MSARSPITLPSPPLRPLITPTTPVRPMPDTTSSTPNERSSSATLPAVRPTSYCSSGWAWMSRRHSATSAARSATRFMTGMVSSIQGRSGVCALPARPVNHPDGAYLACFCRNRPVAGPLFPWANLSVAPGFAKSSPKRKALAPMKKILVAVKRVVDHNVRIRVRPDGSGVETDNVRLSMNPFDKHAVEAAVQLVEQGQAEEVVVVSIGPKGATDVILTALAMGG